MEPGPARQVARRGALRSNWRRRSSRARGRLCAAGADGDPLARIVHVGHHQRAGDNGSATAGGRHDGSPMGPGVAKHPCGTVMGLVPPRSGPRFRTSSSFGDEDEGPVQSHVLYSSRSASSYMTFPLNRHSRPTTSRRYHRALPSPSSLRPRPRLACSSSLSHLSSMSKSCKTSRQRSERPHAKGALTDDR